MSNQYILYFCLLIILFSIYLQINNITEGFEDQPNNSLIPLHIYQTWYTKKLPPKMKECVKKLKKDNPEFEHHLYDDKMCKEFIKNNFDKEVLESFNKLKPGAYKADLWRYCVLYKNGGIYLDIKYQCAPGFKLIELTDKEYFVLERPYADLSMTIKKNLELIKDIDKYISLSTSDLWKNKKIGIYNALIVCRPGNETMYKCIQKCIENIKSNVYGYSPLEPTGPILCGNQYFNNFDNKISDIDLFYSINGANIINKNRVILKQYKEYYKKDNTKTNYHIMWHNKDIYQMG